MPGAAGARRSRPAPGAATAAGTSPFAAAISWRRGRSHVAGRRRVACRRGRGRSPRICGSCRGAGACGLFVSGASFSFTGRSGSVICIHKAMFLGVIRDGRIVVQGDDTCARTAFQNSSRNANWWRSGHQAVAERIPRRRLQRLPFLAALSNWERFVHAARGDGRINAVLQIQRNLPFLVQRMQGHDADFTVLANKHRSCRMVDGLRRMHALRETPNRADRITGVAIKGRRRVEPAAA